MKGIECKQSFTSFFMNIKYLYDKPHFSGLHVFHNSISQSMLYKVDTCLHYDNYAWPNDCKNEVLNKCCHKEEVWPRRVWVGKWFWLRNDKTTHWNWHWDSLSSFHDDKVHYIDEVCMIKAFRRSKDKDARREYNIFDHICDVSNPVFCCIAFHIVRHPRENWVWNIPFLYP